MVSIFVSIVAEAASQKQGFHIVPLQDVIVLSPWTNCVDSDSGLKQLSQYLILEDKGKSPLWFQGNTELKTRHHLLFGYKFPMEQAQITSPVDPIWTTIAQAIPQIEGMPKARTWAETFLTGQWFTFMALAGDGFEEDHPLSEVQFHTCKRGTWINFLMTKDI